MENVIPHNTGPHAAVLDELAAAEQAYRDATEARRRLVREVAGRPEAERPNLSQIGRAMGLPRQSIQNLIR